MKVGIYGLGRFGRFWAGLMARHYEVVAYNRTAGRELPEEVREVSFSEICEVDVLFLCVAISAMEDVLQELAPHIRRDMLVMDTCSVKVYPADLMARFLPDSVSYIATHPMFGPDSGRDGVHGLPMIFCPLRCDDGQRDFWFQAFREFGMQVSVMTPDEHDREAAFSQGITHFIGRVLDTLDLKESAIGTQGYKRLLEIREQTCNDPMQLFFDLQRFNPHTHEMRMRLREALDLVMKKLTAADAESVEVKKGLL